MPSDNVTSYKAWHSENAVTKSKYHRGAWVMSSVKRLTLDLGSGRDLRAVGLSPTLGSALSRVCLRLSLPLGTAPSLKVNKIFLKKQIPHKIRHGPGNAGGRYRMWL